MVGGFKGISAISVCDIAVLGLMAITCTEFTGLVMCKSLKVIRCALGAEVFSFAFLNKVQVASTWCGRCILSERLEVLRSDSFFARSAPGDDIVVSLPTCPTGFLEVEWAHDFHVSILIAISAVRMIIDW